MRREHRDRRDSTGVAGPAAVPCGVSRQGAAGNKCFQCSRCSLSRPGGGNRRRPRGYWL